MEGRNPLLALMVVLVCAFALCGTASARTVGGNVKPAVAEPPICVIHSLPQFMDHGEFENHSSVADLIEVDCQPVFAEHRVEFSAHELASRCKIIWRSGHSPVKASEGAAVKGVELDDAGNAEVALDAGPSCAAGEVLITAHLEEPPFTTVTTAFTILAPHDTTPGVTVRGATNLPVQVEDDFDSSLYAIVEVEFPSVYAEEEVEVAAEQLYARCHVAPKIEWFSFQLGAKIPGEPEAIRLKLDNNGNAYAIIDAEESCASGSSLIEVSLVKAPYTTYTTEFTVESPHETV
jgi:hypothetical protein